MLALFDIIGGAVCHQIPERTIALGGRLLPVCARCTGIYTGIFVSAVFLVFAKRTKGGKPFGIIGALLIAMALSPLVLDGASTYVGLRATTNFVRILTGALFGACVPVLYILALRFDIRGNNDQDIATNVELAVLLATAAVFAVLLYSGVIGGWFSVSVIVCVSVAAFYAGLVYLFVKRLAGLIKGGKYGGSN